MPSKVITQTDTEATSSIAATNRAINDARDNNTEELKPEAFI